MQAAAASNLKRVTLELGGKSPAIVCEDADLDQAVEETHTALFSNQGQCCSAGSRLFVHAKVYDIFVERAAKRAEKAVLGDPFDAKTTQGPQASEGQLQSVLGYIKAGQEEGAKLVTGGERHGDKGFYMQPTVFSHVEDHMTIAREEIFGLVMSIFKYDSYDEVIRRANDSRYGLAAGVWTQSRERGASTPPRRSVARSCSDSCCACAPLTHRACLLPPCAPAHGSGPRQHPRARAARRHGVDQLLRQLRRRPAVRRLQAVGHGARQGRVRARAVHRNQARPDADQKPGGVEVSGTRPSQSPTCRPRARCCLQ